MQRPEVWVRSRRRRDRCQHEVLEGVRHEHPSHVLHAEDWVTVFVDVVLSQRFARQMHTAATTRMESTCCVDHGYLSEGNGACVGKQAPADPWKLRGQPPSLDELALEIREERRSRVSCDDATVDEIRVGRERIARVDQRSVLHVGQTTEQVRNREHDARFD